MKPTIAVLFKRLHALAFYFCLSLTLLLVHLDLLWLACGSAFVTLTALIYYREMIAMAKEAEEGK